MPSLSLRAQLGKIHAAAPIAIRHGLFLSFPSLRKTMQMMEPPRISEWAAGPTFEYDNEDWTEECQGIVCDGHFIYASSNNADAKGVYKLNLQFQVVARALLDSVSPGASPSRHLGALSIWNGTLYVPIASQDGAAVGPAVWTLDAATLHSGAIQPLLLPPDLGALYFGWCAINPWDGLLYTADASHQSARIDSFDPAAGFAHRRRLDLSDAVAGPQGGCISSRGHLYLVSQRVPANRFELLAYTMMDGQFLGSQPLSYDDSDLSGEEPEAIALFRIDVGSVSTHVQVLVLDNDLGGDDVQIRTFIVPDPTVL